MIYFKNIVLQLPRRRQGENPEPKATGISPVSQRKYGAPYCLTFYLIYNIIKEKKELQNEDNIL